jgi:hypothetical protein
VRIGQSIEQDRCRQEDQQKWIVVEQHQATIPGASRARNGSMPEWQHRWFFLLEIGDYPRSPSGASSAA